MGESSRYAATYIRQQPSRTANSKEGLSEREKGFTGYMSADQDIGFDGVLGLTPSL